MERGSLYSQNHLRTELPLLMLWTAPVTGVAMCHIAVIEVQRESVLG